MQQTIILIGYRATGKTSVGQRLAERLGLRFIDMDHELENRMGQSIAAMVAAQGWAPFRALELEVLAELITVPGLVLSTGGGAILHQGLWPRVMAAGLVVWLMADLATIRQRLLADPRTASQRPGLTGNDPYAEIAQVLAQRQPLYRAGCHLAVDTASLKVDEIVELIAARTCNENRTVNAINPGEISAHQKE